MTEIREIRVWINAFIPRDVPGATFPRPEHAGQTMIQSPAGFFGTDNRSFSSAPSASAREHVELVIRNPGTAQQQVEIPTPRYGPTPRFDPQTGAVLEQRTATTTHEGSNSRFSDVGFHATLGSAPVQADQVAGTRALPRGIAAPTDRVIVADVSIAGSNPVVPGVPRMDLQGTIVINLTTGTVSFIGQVDDFPAYEGYFQINGGNPQTLFQIEPPGGPGGVVDVLGNQGLFGPAHNPIVVTRSVDPNADQDATAPPETTSGAAQLTTPQADAGASTGKPGHRVEDKMDARGADASASKPAPDGAAPEPTGIGAPENPQLSNDATALHYPDQVEDLPTATATFTSDELLQQAAETQGSNPPRGNTTTDVARSGELSVFDSSGSAGPRSDGPSLVPLTAPAVDEIGSTLAASANTASVGEQLAEEFRDDPVSSGEEYVQEGTHLNDGWPTPSDRQGKQNEPQEPLSADNEGWSIVASDADRTSDDKRSLSGGDHDSSGGWGVDEDAIARTGQSAAEDIAASRASTGVEHADLASDAVDTEPEEDLLPDELPPPDAAT